jgi:hypothetical protein
MTAKNPFKKVILDLEASLNSIEEEISSIPDPSINNVITELLSNVIKILKIGAIATRAKYRKNN